jgi:hypothetical protein
MMNEGHWSEDPTRLYPREQGACGVPQETFTEDGGHTVLEPADSIFARLHAAVGAPARSVPRAQPPLPPPVRPAREGAPPSPPGIPRLATPPPLPPRRLPRLPTPPASLSSARVPDPLPHALQPNRPANGERRLTLTPLPVAPPPSTLTPLPVARAESVMPPPLAPITHHPRLTPSRALRAAHAHHPYRFIGMVALTGLALGMALLHGVRAILG